MKILLTAALIAGVSTTALAGETATKPKANMDKEPAKAQPVEDNFPESVRSQVLQGRLSEKHKEYLLRQQQAWDLYN